MYTFNHQKKIKTHYSHQVMTASRLTSRLNIVHFESSVGRLQGPMTVFKEC